MSHRIKDDAAQHAQEGEQDTECVICHQTCHFAFMQCECCPTRAACLVHASSLCACPPSRWHLAFRYSIADLERLVEAIAMPAAQLRALHTLPYTLRDSPCCKLVAMIVPANPMTANLHTSANENSDMISH